MKKRKEFKGKVVSAKMANTVIVEVAHETRHPLYKKIVKRTKRFAAHVDGLTLAEGEYVTIAETKPISKTKHFLVVGKTKK